MTLDLDPDFERYLDEQAAERVRDRMEEEWDLMHDEWAEGW